MHELTRHQQDWIQGGIGTLGTLIKRHSLLFGTAAALAAMATFARYQTSRTERENPPTGRFTEVDGVRLHYLERGQGQALVLLHGNGTLAGDFELSGLLEGASRNHRVIAFDRPGYGYSDRPGRMQWNPLAQAHLLHQALQGLGIERPLIVAHSWATLVAIALALEYPQHVRGLVLLSGYYYPTPRLDVPMLSPPAIPLLGDLMRHTVSPLLGRLLWPAMVRKQFSPADTPARFREAYPVWMSKRPSQIRANAEESAMMLPSVIGLGARYRDLTVPVIIMAGAGDLHALPGLHSERLHRDVPHSELQLVPGVGHMIHYSAPREILSAIDRLKSEVPAHPVGQPEQPGGETVASGP